MKFKLFTQTDLDGYGCSLVLQHYCNHTKKDVDVSYCDYGSGEKSLDFQLLKFLEEPYKWDEYDQILITDISPSIEVAKILDEKIRNRIILLDHHETALHLAVYPWAKIDLKTPNGDMACATWMVYEHFKDYLDKISTISGFVEVVRRYDTWEWKTKYNDDIPPKLNKIFYLYGGDEFIKIFLGRIPSMYSDSHFFTAEEVFYLKWEEEKARRMIDDIIQNKLTKVEIDNVKMAIAFSDIMASELGNAISERNPDMDMAVVVSFRDRTVSLRTTKKDVNVASYAKTFGGGGHPQAAGFRLTDNNMDTIISWIRQNKEIAQ